MPFQFLEALRVSRPDLPHPSRRSLRKFRVVLLFPGAFGGAQSLTLLLDFDLAARDFSDKCAASPFADQLVNFSHHVDWQDDVGSFVHTLEHILSVT